MNRTKIEWADYTWNPVTGCLHGCPYCYAARIVGRFGGDHADAKDIQEALELVCGFNKDEFEVTGKCVSLDYAVCGMEANEPYPFGFRPTFHRYRLNEPARVKKPARIFAVSMGDLFGDWVPMKWIWQILSEADKCSRHTFMFLTKNPQRYLEYSGVKLGAWPHGNEERIAFPGNCWAGVSVTDVKSWTWISCRIHHVLAPVKFISIEPLFEDVFKFINANGIPLGVDWVIVGAQTGPGAVKVKPEWIERIIVECRDAKVPVFLKDNLGWPEKIQEFPAKGGVEIAR